MSRMHLLIAAILALAALAFTATADDGGAAQMQNVDEFDAIHFALPGELTLVQTDTPMVSIDATAKQLEAISVDVDDGVLTIKRRRGNWRNLDLDEVRLQVGYQSIDQATVAGSGTLIADSISNETFALAVSGSGDALLQALECGTAKITVAGSGEVQINRMDARSTATKISGSGDILLAGSAGEQTLSIAGSGDYQAGELLTETAELSIAGSGTATLNVRDKISGSVMGSGDLFYRGEPDVAVRVAGSGDITKLEGTL